MARVPAVSNQLKHYRAKRDFLKTSEPRGHRKVKASKRLRYVIQKHAATRLHYDLRLEIGGVLKSWAVTCGPSRDPRDKRLAVEVEDHPLAYGDFEGTIPKGEYGGGAVLLWDRGYWTPEPGIDPIEALRTGKLKFVVRGERLRGGYVLVRLRRREGEKRSNWLLIKHRDPYAVDGDKDALLRPDMSVASGRSMKQISTGKARKATDFMAPANRARAASADGKAKPRPGASKKAGAADRAASQRGRRAK